MITPLDIQNKEFKKSLVGYRTREVDAYLDSINEDYEKLYKENIDLKDRIRSLADQINQFRTMEKTLRETLVTAQKTADDVIDVAQKKSELIIREAEEMARQIREDADKAVIEANREQFEIKKQIKILKSKIKSLLETHIEQIEQISEDAAAAQEHVTQSKYE